MEFSYRNFNPEIQNARDPSVEVQDSVGRSGDTTPLRLGAAARRRRGSPKAARRESAPTKGRPDWFRQKSFIHRFNEADKAAFLAAYGYFAPRLFQYCYFKTGADKDLAEDLAQSVFYKTWEYLASDKRKAIGNIQAFLYRIARNAVIDHWRRGKKEPLPLMEEMAEVSDNARWRDQADKVFEFEELVQVIKIIPPQYREVIELRYFEQLEISEICEVLDKSSNSVYVLLHRALRAVRLKLRERENDAAGRQKLGLLIAQARD